jgi:uncharacterized protein YbjT (DUF2867 family)
VNDTAPSTVLLAGATGMVGGRCLQRLLADPAFGTVVAVARRPPDVAHDRLRLAITEFSLLHELAPVPAATALCALGTTIKVAGSQAAFRAVDHDAVLAFARWARRGGAGTFVLCSSVGADSRSRNFYLRTKGEVEQALATLGFGRLVILRPGLLLGERAEPRAGEAVARKLAPALNVLLAGPLRRYRAISADGVAAAMVAAARGSEDGQLLWEHDAIVAASSAAP